MKLRHNATTDERVLHRLLEDVATQNATLAAELQQRLQSLGEHLETLEACAECLHLVGEKLTQVLGQTVMRATPPRFYPEAIHNLNAERLRERQRRQFLQHADVFVAYGLREPESTVSGISVYTRSLNGFAERRLVFCPHPTTEEAALDAALAVWRADLEPQGVSRHA